MRKVIFVWKKRKGKQGKKENCGRKMMEYGLSTLCVLCGRSLDEWISSWIALPSSLSHLFSSTASCKVEEKVMTMEEEEDNGVVWGILVQRWGTDVHLPGRDNRIQNAADWLEQSCIPFPKSHLLEFFTFILLTAWDVGDSNRECHPNTKSGKILGEKLFQQHSSHYIHNKNSNNMQLFNKK